MDKRSSSRGRSSRSNIAKLQAMSMAELNQMASEMGVENFGTMRKHEVIFHILQKNAERSGVLFSEGVLEVLPEGFGFLRSQSFQLSALPGGHLRFALADSPVRSADRQSDRRPDSSAQRQGTLFRAAQGRSGRSAKIRTRPRTKPISTISRRCSRTSVSFWKPRPDELSTRVLDLVCPIGKGTRGLIVAPPRTGKTVLMQKLANAILKNNPEAYLFILLIDERPEEVTDMERTCKRRRSDQLHLR